ncbi:unnamed protein product [Phytophthora lilii]|uniref:Unnamed protein product n=1 Tax=Phytophthora lilii TaxID=2077276 RepID=A0A9W6T7R6_9STRA|nr:unnamed protein product [Phytophthora lilii]
MEERIPLWSVTNYLQSDRSFNRWQFSKSLCVAAGRGDLVVVEWLLAHFSDCYDIPEEAVQEAAEGGHLYVLRILWENRPGAQGYGISHRNNRAQLGDHVVETWCTVGNPYAMHCLDAKVEHDCYDEKYHSLGHRGAKIRSTYAQRWGISQCLNDEIHFGLADQEVAIKHALNTGKFSIVKRLLPVWKKHLGLCQ